MRCVVLTTASTSTRRPRSIAVCGRQTSNEDEGGECRKDTQGPGDERELIIDCITPPDFGVFRIDVFQFAFKRVPVHRRLETADEVSEPTSVLVNRPVICRCLRLSCQRYGDSPSGSVSSQAVIHERQDAFSIQIKKKSIKTGRMPINPLPWKLFILDEKCFPHYGARLNQFQ